MNYVSNQETLLKRGEVVINKDKRKFRVGKVTKNNFDVIIYHLEPLDNGKKTLLINNKIFQDEYKKV